ncbi:MAG: hypothetical protein J6Y06_06365 [Bacteroidales bacterium]|nr:hypothetical protein [Bacteroidales bacterium]
MRHIRIILSAVAVAATLFAVTFCSGRSDKELKAIVLDMCRYIPDHGMRDDAEDNLTNSYFDAYSGALNSIPENDGMIGDEEFLYYFVSGQDGEPEFKVKSVEQKGDSLVAMIILQDNTPHVVKLVKEGGRYLLDDFDDTKQLCLNFIKSHDKYSGEWAEKTAERIVAVFTPIENGYKVKIGWREEGLAQYEIWEMTAVTDGNGGLTYDDATYKVRQYEHQGDKDYKENTVYTDGAGAFCLNDEGELVWKDGKNPEQEETPFIRANFTTE